MTHQPTGAPDFELIARMLDVCRHPKFTLAAYEEQAALLRAFDNASSRAETVRRGGEGGGVDDDELLSALEMPEGYGLAVFIPGVYQYEYDREDGERMASGTSWNHPALAAIAAWQSYAELLASGCAVGDCIRVGDIGRVNKDDQAMNWIMRAEVIQTPRGEGDVWGFRNLDNGQEVFTNERFTFYREQTP